VDNAEDKTPTVAPRHGNIHKRVGLNENIHLIRWHSVWGKLPSAKICSCTYRSFCKIAKCYFWLRHVCLFARLHGKSRPPLDTFSYNL